MIIIMLLSIRGEVYSQSTVVDSTSLLSTFNLFDVDHEGMRSNDEMIAQIKYIRSGVSIIAVQPNINSEDLPNIVEKSVNGLVMGFDLNGDGLNFT
jgi:Ca2+-binding EF-hand superfamily protein